ncbi:CHAD domain-containing protein [Streptomyces spiroverticillatus]|uniref:CHAD domain-containing protein n=1 Tax=Streptomyces finlayi TaxID=67296 RepID=A0A918X4K4_9ACTN|nr:CHAD domain-containing protein [Streptomyces finlayi]GHA33589.1 CHAD domain-containing protein [Streptomyces spiroverticillatus]GHD11357.1 CHAD domain-containing protein [Streptomyces finlayi]
MLAEHLHAQAAEFLRALRRHREGSDATDPVQSARSALDMRRAARRIGGALHTFRPMTDTAWADPLRAELAWLSGTLAREHACAARLGRLLEGMERLGAAPAAVPGQREDPSGPSVRENALGIARAGALLERQLTLARTRAHSAALQALGSSRFHALADAVALLASDAPVVPGNPYEHASRAARRLTEAVDALPLGRAARPYNAEAVHDGQDSPWHHVRLLLRLHRYAAEVTGGDTSALAEAGRALDRHRDAAEAAAAAAAAARTARIAPATAYALGVLHSSQRHEVEAARFGFQRAWRQAVVAG